MSISIFSARTASKTLTFVLSTFAPLLFSKMTRLQTKTWTTNQTDLSPIPHSHGFDFITRSDNVVKCPDIVRIFGCHLYPTLLTFSQKISPRWVKDHFERTNPLATTIVPKVAIFHFLLNYWLYQMTLWETPPNRASLTPTPSASASWLSRTIKYPSQERLERRLGCTCMHHTPRQCLKEVYKSVLFEPPVARSFPLYPL